MKLSIAEAIKLAGDRINSAKKDAIKVIPELQVYDRDADTGVMAKTLTAGLYVSNLPCLFSALVFAARTDDLDCSDIDGLHVKFDEHVGSSVITIF